MQSPWFLKTGESKRCQPPSLHCSLFTGGPVTGSQVSPTPSRSKSSWPGLATKSQLSNTSATPSLSSSASTQSGLLSPSLSADLSSASTGLEPQASSSASVCPSLSSSVSVASGVPSASVSSGGLVPLMPASTQRSMGSGRFSKKS